VPGNPLQSLIASKFSHRRTFRGIRKVDRCCNLPAGPPLGCEPSWGSLCLGQPLGLPLPPLLALTYAVLPFLHHPVAAASSVFVSVRTCRCVSGVFIRCCFLLVASPADIPWPPITLKPLGIVADPKNYARSFPPCFLSDRGLTLSVW